MSTRALRTGWIIGSSLIAGWLGMMVVHELGHIVFAWLTGGSVRTVSVPLMGLSYTVLDVNPRPVAVAWGGFVVGSTVPLGLWLIAQGSGTRVEPGARFFAALCLFANGAYMSSALARPVGDVEDIVLCGGARWPLMVAGPVVLAGGFAVLGRQGASGLLREADRANRFGVVVATGLLIAAVIAARGMTAIW